MPFRPQAIGRSALKFPENRLRILFLSQPAKEAWYAAQDPNDLTLNDPRFTRFWSFCYGWHLKTKRFLYRFKFW